LPSLFVHCAALSQPRRLGEISDADWDEVMAVGCRAAFIACQELAPRLGQRGGDIILVGALDRGQSLPLPVHFAAAQGLLGSMSMALAKELGASGIRVNLLALGPLDGGLSAQLPATALHDFKTYSALRRLGTADEVARAVLWLGQRNTFMTGRVLTVNGGI
jgi:3-oxoacyl-[acyl-carrier protein] reductase